MATKGTREYIDFNSITRRGPYPAEQEGNPGSTTKRPTDYSILEVKIKEMVPPELAKQLTSQQDSILSDLLFDSHTTLQNITGIEIDFLRHLTVGLAQDEWPVTFQQERATRGEYAGQEQPLRIFNSEVDVLAYMVWALREHLEMLQAKRALSKKRGRQAAKS